MAIKRGLSFLYSYFNAYGVNISTLQYIRQSSWTQNPFIDFAYGQNHWHRKFSTSCAA